jgi:hypothetical protein
MTNTILFNSEQYQNEFNSLKTLAKRDLILSCLLIVGIAMMLAFIIWQVYVQITHDSLIILLNCIIFGVGIIILFIGGINQYLSSISPVIVTEDRIQHGKYKIIINEIEIMLLKSESNYYVFFLKNLHKRFLPKRNILNVKDFEQVMISNFKFKIRNEL